MIDPNAEVLQVETEDGIHFVLRRDLEEFTENREVIDQQVLVPQGTMARFTGREGRQFGFVKYLASDLAGVARALDVPQAALKEDQSLLADWDPIMLDINGPVTAQLASQFSTLIGQELDKREVNWIGLRIDSTGGDLDACVRLAAMMAQLDANSVRTVAYVPHEASGGDGAGGVGLRPDHHARGGANGGRRTSRRSAATGPGPASPGARPGPNRGRPDHHPRLGRPPGSPRLVAASRDD